MTAILTPALDRVEERLPIVPRQIFRLNRALAGRAFDLVEYVSKNTRNSFCAVADRGRVGIATVRGQADEARETTTESIRSTANVARTKARQVTGQATAQAKATTDLAADEAASILDDVVNQVEGGPTGSYSTWTKAELYERAQQLDIDGRSSMSKTQLISALRSA